MDNTEEESSNLRLCLFFFISFQKKNQQQREIKVIFSVLSAVYLIAKALHRKQC